MRRHSLPPLIVVCLIAGCAVGPDYQRPAVDLPAGWRADPPSAAASDVSSAASVATAASAVPATEPSADAAPVGSAELVNTPWWSSFGDPQLNALIRIALDENKNLQIAAARIEQFDATLQVSKSAGLPQASYGASRTRDTLSENRQLPLTAGAKPVDNSYEVAAKVGWELDLWGKIARANEASLANLLASEESRRALVLSLVADVASSYVRLIGLDTELDLMRRNAASRRETLRLLESKLAGGGIAELPVLRARSELEDSLADLPAKENEIAALENALSALLGRNPGPIARGRPANALALPAIPGGLPAQLLAQRPDVRKAEQDLVAANAKIGVAKAQYLPDIALTAQSGYASDDLSKLTLLTSNFGTYGISLLGPLFTSGRISGQVRAAEAVQHQMATAYLLAVQTAVREVEDALVTNRKTYQRMAVRVRQINALRDLRTSAIKRYDGGYVSYTEVLEAERALYAGELQQSQTRRDQFVALIAVYKAMGGGWSVVDTLASSSTPTAKTDHE